MAIQAASGELHFLSSISFSPAPIAVNDSAQMFIGHMRRSGNIRRLAALIAEDAIFFASPDDRVQVLSSEGGWSYVEFVEGEQKRRRGWVPMSWLRPAPAAVSDAPQTMRMAG